jgi:alpha-L-fucosidase 2
MLYEILARVHTTPIASRRASGSPSTTRCIQLPVAAGVPPNATIKVDSSSASDTWISWVGGTEYALEAGDAAHGFSFRGPDPHDALSALLSPSTPMLTFSGILDQHVRDYKAALTDKFSLSLGQKPKLDLPTDVLKAEYKTDIGDTYLEWLMFNYGRYLLASSARGALPANLQGKWANGYENPWGAGECTWLASGLGVADFMIDYREKSFSSW